MKTIKLGDGGEIGIEEDGDGVMITCRDIKPETVITTRIGLTRAQVATLGELFTLIGKRSP